MKTIRSSILLAILNLQCFGATYYVATNGTAGGSGAISDPLSLTKAIGNTSPASPGDTVWLRGGTYFGPAESFLVAPSNNPIVVRQYPGERSIIDGVSNSVNPLTISGSGTWYWGFEVTCSDTNRYAVRGDGVEMNPSVSGIYNKLINLCIHDTGDGVFVSHLSTNVEIYGCVIYNGGYQLSDRGHGHHLYVQNQDTQHEDFLSDNIGFNSFDNGIQVFAQSANNVNIRLVGNVIANSGSTSTNSWAQNWELGGYKTADQIKIFNNHSYFPESTYGVQFYYPSGGSNGTINVSSNVWVNSRCDIFYWTNSTYTYNTQYAQVRFRTPLTYDSLTSDHNAFNSVISSSPVEFQISPLTLPSWQALSGQDSNSTITASAPSGQWVYVRRNAYEPTRANVIVYNWDHSDTAPVNLASFVPVGSGYTIRNAADYGGSIVSVGVYSGGTVSLPMTNLSVATPTGMATAPTNVSPEFAVFVVSPSTIYLTDGTAANIQSNINAAAIAGPGNIVQIPAGNFVISSTITFSNANSVILQGLGSGKVIDEFTNNLTIGTGVKVMTVHSGLPITVGQTLTVERLGGNVLNGVGSKPVPSFLGTVNSYSGSTLVMTVTTTTGTNGTTHPVWIISTQPTTTITNLVAGSGDLLSVFESTTGYNEISGIRFTGGAVGNNSGAHINLHKGSGNPTLTHDDYFYSDQSLTCINCTDNKGVIWSNDFVAAPFSSARLAIHLQDGPTSSWNNKSTFGTNDLTGTSNVYIEDCTFHAFLNLGDFDDSIRAVLRYSLWNASGTGTHGADTSNYGVRGWEFYKNRALHYGYNNGQTLNESWWIFLRGGTGVCWSNDFPKITSGDYGHRSSYSLTVFNLEQSGGPHGCWGQGTSGGADYPAPRQVGLGNPTGASSPADAFAYLGASEPAYFWANENTGGVDFGWRDGQGGGCTPPVDGSTNYIVQNRDFFTNTVAPNYAPYTYPHPLRSQIPPTPPVPPPTTIARVTNLHVGRTIVGP